MNLQEYYNTLWWRKRSRAYRERIGRCDRCNSTKDLQTHHRRYRFFSEQDSDLECLCNDCHQKGIHKHKDEMDMLDLDFNHQNDTGRLVHLIDQALEQKSNQQKPRDYLGGSRLGVECSRALQFEFFNTPKDEGKDFSGQILRAFQIGHVLEDMAADWLRQAGLDLRTEKPDGRQFGFSTGAGYIRGHIDGVIVGGPDEIGPYSRLWEMKTSNGKKWREMQKSKLRKANWTYFVQCQLYMAYMELTENPALFTAINKDTSELYFENIEFNPQVAQEASDRGADIIEASLNGEILPRISQDSSFYLCRWCAWSDRCWGMEP